MYITPCCVREKVGVWTRLVTQCSIVLLYYKHQIACMIYVHERCSRSIDVEQATLYSNMLCVLYKAQESPKILLFGVLCCVLLVYSRQKMIDHSQYIVEHCLQAIISDYIATCAVCYRLVLIHYFATKIGIS